jgi:hypothetical protein
VNPDIAALAGQVAALRRQVAALADILQNQQTVILRAWNATLDVERPPPAPVLELIPGDRGDDPA